MTLSAKTTTSGATRQQQQGSGETFLERRFNSLKNGTEFPDHMNSLLSVQGRAFPICPHTRGQDLSTQMTLCHQRSDGTKFPLGLKSQFRGVPHQAAELYPRPNLPLPRWSPSAALALMQSVTFDSDRTGYGLSSENGQGPINPKMKKDGAWLLL